MTKHKRKKVTVTVADFAATSRSSGVMSYIGWDSSQMTAVRSALADYELKRSEGARTVLALAVRRWRAEQPNEFSNRNTLSAGVAQQLYDEVVMPELGHAIDGLILHGVDNPTSDRKPIPKVSVTDTSVMGLMIELLGKNRRVGVIVIDIYGTSLQSVGLDKKYGGETTVEENIQEVLEYVEAAEIAYRTHIPVINFTMKQERTMVGIAQSLPGGTTHIVKPSNNIFEGSNVDQVLADSGATHWIVTGFDANYCVAASIFGAPTAKAVGFIDKRNQYGVMEKMAQYGWCRGLLDRGYNVVTSRRILCSTSDALQSMDGWPWLGPSNR